MNAHITELFLTELSSASFAIANNLSFIRVHLDLAYFNWLAILRSKKKYGFLIRIKRAR